PPAAYPTTAPPEPIQAEATLAPVAASETPAAFSHPRGSRVGQLMGGMAWNVGFPVGSVSNFTGDPSASGLEFLLKYWIHPQITIGGSVDWQTYADQRPRTTYQRENGAITATAYNSVLLGAIRAGGDFYFLADGPVLPYAGANVGFGWSTLQTAASDLAIYDNQSSIVLGLGAGVLIDPSPRAPKILLGGRYSAEPVVSFLSSVHDIQTIVLQLGVIGR
ncbi:MAG TPA: hypothetical protein VJV79_37490, partial [Polyangiaceae bacterium]|nr:hypothetical protein [Polyangiaceae bacterium]